MIMTIFSWILQEIGDFDRILLDFIWPSNWRASIPMAGALASIGERPPIGEQFGNTGAIQHNQVFVYIMDNGEGSCP